MSLEHWKDVDTLQMFVDSDWARHLVAARSSISIKHRDLRHCRRLRPRDTQSEVVPV